MANLFLIRNLCEERKITFRELCKRIGRDESALQSAIRRGSTKTETLEAVAKELDVQPGYFFDGYLTDNLSEKYTLEIKHLRELLEEKERTIRILMDEKKSKGK